MSAQQIYDEVIIDKFNGRTPGFPACRQGMGLLAIGVRIPIPELNKNVCSANL